eukprot:c7632_g1_i2 orf=2-268(-)
MDRVPEAMSSYLSAHEVGLQGLRLTIGGEELLDAEFANDTAMHLHGHEANLRRSLWSADQLCLLAWARGSSLADTEPSISVGPCRGSSV